MTPKNTGIDTLDRILADHDQITPSRDFLKHVMEAVEREAAAPVQPPFPWLRALPGFAALLAALIASAWQGIGALGDPAAVELLSAQFQDAMTMASGLGLPWAGLAIVVTAAAVIVPVTLARAGMPAMTRRPQSG